MTDPTDTFILTEEQKAQVEEVFRKLDAYPNYGLDCDEVKKRLGIDDKTEL